MSTETEISVEIRLFGPRKAGHLHNTGDPRLGSGIVKIPADSKEANTPEGGTFTLEKLLCIVDEKYPGNDMILASARLPSAGFDEEVERLEALGFTFASKPGRL